jgi:hypothetical protein
VAVFDIQGRHLRDLGSRPAEHLNLAEVGVVFADPSGRLFVLDTTSRIWILSRDGHEIASIAGTLPGLGMLDLTGMALDPSGVLYLVDDGRRLVRLQLGPPLWPAERASPRP